MRLSVSKRMLAKRNSLIILTRIKIFGHKRWFNERKMKIYNESPCTQNLTLEFGQSTSTDKIFDTNRRFHVTYRTTGKRQYLAFEYPMFSLVLTKFSFSG